MTRILDATAAFLEADGWPVHRTDDGSGIRTAAGQGDNKWLCYALAREEQEQLVVYSVCPFTAPEPTRAAAAELLTRANWGLFLGAFEMDFDDGEIRFRTAVSVEGVELTPSLIRPVFYANALAMGRYLPAIDAVCLHDADPAEAIDDLEF